jgi:hypothetical protein
VLGDISKPSLLQVSPDLLSAGDVDAEVVQAASRLGEESGEGPVIWFGAVVTVLHEIDLLALDPAARCEILVLQAVCQPPFHGSEPP